MATNEATVRLGSRVRITDADGEDEFLVEEDADIARGRISQDSPLGRAIMGRRAGDSVLVRTPGGVRSVTVVGVVSPPQPASAHPLP
jgi:transcription elongation GreA/GreB family factor